jgi:hypothetical protein
MREGERAIRRRDARLAYHPPMDTELATERPALPEGERGARNPAMVGGAALLAGIAVGVGMGIKMRAGAQHLERRMDDYRSAWHQIRGR